MTFSLGSKKTVEEAGRGELVIAKLNGVLVKHVAKLAAAPR
jgi:hypothetical protein